MQLFAYGICAFNALKEDDKVTIGPLVVGPALDQSVSTTIDQSASNRGSVNRGGVNRRAKLISL